MLRGLWNAAAGMRSQQQKIDVTANNIANVNTNGYKRKSTIFRDLIYQSIERRGNAVAPAPPGEKKAAAGTGSAVAAVQSDMRPGSLQHTGGSTDFALSGDGYFRVTLPDGREAYTRDGNFRLDGQGAIVTSSGYRVRFPQLPAQASELSVAADGSVTVTVEGGRTQTAGRLELARFNNPQGLEQLGNNLVAATPSAGAPVLFAPGEGTKVMQGYLESSNVDLAEEMVELLIGQRAFELNSRSLRTADEMWGMANQLRK